MSNSLDFPLDPTEAAVQAIADALNDVGGLRMTRLTAVAAIGASSLTVETTIGWAASGDVWLGGVRHAYTGKTDTSFTGLTPTVPVALNPRSVVVDGNKDYSQLETARRMLLVDYSEEEFLGALGRNVKVQRPTGMGDTIFRAYLKVAAYLPRGTVYSMERVLDAIIGPSNYTIREDLASGTGFHVVEVELTDPAPTDPTGKGYLAKAQTDITPTSTTELEIDDTPTTVKSIHLDSHDFFVTGDVLPSAEPEAWTYTGGGVEATHVTLGSAGELQMADADDSALGFRYEKDLPNVDGPATSFSFELLFNVAGTALAASAPEEWKLLNVRLHDGARVAVVALEPAGIAVYDSAGTQYGATKAVTWGPGQHLLRVRRVSTYNASKVVVELDGELAVEVDFASFSGATASRKVEFGSFSSAAGSEFVIDAYWWRVQTEDHNEYTNFQGVAGTTNSADPDRITAGTGIFDSALDPRAIINVVVASDPRCLGVFVPSAIDDPAGAWADLKGIDAPGATIVSSRVVTIPQSTPRHLQFGGLHGGLFGDQDYGAKGDVTIGTVPANNAVLYTQRYGGDPAGALTVKHFDPGGASALSVANALSVITVTLEHDGATPVSTAQEVIDAVNAHVGASEYVVASNATGSSGAGVAILSATLPTTGGSDGKYLTISGSGLGNDGSYLIANVIDRFTVEVGTAVAATAMVAEAATTWRKDPNFPTATGVVWLTSGSQVTNSTTVVVRLPLPSTSARVVVEYTTVESGQVLYDASEANDPVDDFHPMYLADPFDYLREILEDVVVAGVLVRTSHQ